MYDEWLTSSFAAIPLRIIYKEGKQPEDNYNPSVPKNTDNTIVKRKTPKIQTTKTLHR